MVETEQCLTFQNRRAVEPQAIIDALIGQTARQGKAIFELLARVDALEAENLALRAGKSPAQTSFIEPVAVGFDPMEPPFDWP